MMPPDDLRARPLWGHLPAFARNPLGVLSACAQTGRRAVPLRFLHIPAIVLLHSEDIERVLVTEHREFVKPAWLRTAAVQRLLGSGLVTSDGEEWRAQRHACQPAFQPRRIDGYGHKIAALAHDTLSGWRPGSTIGLQAEMSHLTLQVIARTLLDVDTADWTADASRSMDALMARFSSPVGLYGMAPLPPSLTELRAARTLNASVEDLIRQSSATRASAGGELPPLVAMLADHARGETSSAGRRHALRDQIKTFLGAGYESSALTLTWAFLILGSNPDAERALAAEVRAITSDVVGPEAIARLPFTAAVIKETLRLFPPLWMTGRQTVRSCEIGGIRIPGRTLVMTSQWAVHRRAEYFDRPAEFRPERWLNGETDELPRFAYFPFGGGPRVCIGQGFAMMESVLLLAAIARRFKVEPAANGNIEPWATMTLRPPPDIQARLVDR